MVVEGRSHRVKIGYITDAVNYISLINYCQNHSQFPLSFFCLAECGNDLSGVIHRENMFVLYLHLLSCCKITIANQTLISHQVLCWFSIICSLV